jgi:hypothetical protein
MLKLTVSSVAIAAAFLTSASATARTISIPFNASNFSAPLTIDNIYFPLIAGTVYTYRADTKDGCEVDVVTVTYETRDLDGVTTRKVHDSVFDGDACTTDSSALTEDTFDFYAQDDGGNVWYSVRTRSTATARVIVAPARAAGSRASMAAFRVLSCSPIRAREIPTARNSPPTWPKTRRR